MRSACDRNCGRGSGCLEVPTAAEQGLAYPCVRTNSLFYHIRFNPVINGKIFVDKLLRFGEWDIRNHR